MPEVKLISGSLFDMVAALATASPRLRMNYNFHSGPADNPHRFLNVLLRGTYIRPHRHLAPPKSESFLVLEGMADVILFDDEGEITARHRLGADSPEGHMWGHRYSARRLAHNPGANRPGGLFRSQAGPVGGSQ